jgi:hypothetical protein
MANNNGNQFREDEIIKYDENLAAWLSSRVIATDSALRWRGGSS